jgi:hypothetical protein
VVVPITPRDWHAPCATLSSYADATRPAAQPTEEVIAVDEELIGLRRELADKNAAVCDLCGRPLPRAELNDLAVDRGMGEPVEAVQVCPACGRAASQDDVPFDAEIAAGLRDRDD